VHITTETATKSVSRYRALGSLCRQQAAYNPADSWKLLAKAEHWEHLAQLEMSFHFEECNNEATPARNVSQRNTLAA
jgi:hypothetical protein